MCLDLNRNKTLQLRHWHNAYLHWIDIGSYGLPQKKGVLLSVLQISLLRIIFWCTCYHALAFAAECNKHTGVLKFIYFDYPGRMNCSLYSFNKTSCLVTFSFLKIVFSHPFINNNKNNKNLACLCEQFRTLRILVCVGYWYYTSFFESSSFIDIRLFFYVSSGAGAD